MMIFIAGLGKRVFTECHIVCFVALRFSPLTAVVRQFSHILPFRFVVFTLNFASAGFYMTRHFIFFASAVLYAI
jgi:hypothetical protein